MTDSLDAVGELAARGAANVRDAFDGYQTEFRTITARARIRFETRDWRGTQQDAAERLDLRPRSVGAAVQALRQVLGPAAADGALRRRLKAAYDRALANRADGDLARTYFNSVTRRLFGTVGVDPDAEFVAGTEAPIQPPGATPLHRTYLPMDTTERLVTAVLHDFAFSVPYRDLAGDARVAAAALDGFLRSARDAPPLEAIEILKPVFFRGKGAYLVGRIRRGPLQTPLVLALLHDEQGVSVDAVLPTAHDARVVFSFTRSYFHVEVERPSALVEFLRTILPQKPVSELYIAIGHHKHGKTLLYREILDQLAATADRFEPARGDRGMVMIVFTLPSLPVAFKVIRDRFAPPKTLTRQDVQQKYALVFRHDRAGRLVDAQEFEHLVFARDRFAPELLEELRSEAGETVRVDADRVLIRHLYAERCVTPLNLFIRERDDWTAREALLDYGQAIRDLAATNTFPGDLLLKNFGVTRTGRVIFYDYDELCLVTDCRFRDLPTARDELEETSGEPWFHVGENDVFPEEFLPFLGLPERLRAPFLAAHGEIMTAAFWRRMQARHRAGEIVDIFPYRESQRLRNAR